MRARLAIVLAASAVITPLWPRPAQAYVRALNDYGSPYYWPTSCAGVTVYLNGFTMMTRDEVAKSIAAAAHAWSPSEVTCPAPDGDAGTGHPYFEIVPSISTGGPVPGAVYDGQNSIIFETTHWTDMSPELIAFTEHFSLQDGEIVDTDMEINATPASLATWANLDTGSPPPEHGQFLTDLQTAITHEFGHFIGLAHTCFNSTVDPPAASTDDQGQAVPACPDPNLNQLCPPPADIPQDQSVMWFYVCAELTTKRVLSPDDIRAVCDLFPAAQDPHTCTLNLPDDGCGCATGGTHPVEAAALSLLAIGLALAHARMHRR